jgi:hypothetical protein
MYEKFKRRWFRFGLRTMFVVVVVASVMLPGCKPQKPARGPLVLDGVSVTLDGYDEYIGRLKWEITDGALFIDGRAWCSVEEGDAVRIWTGPESLTVTLNGDRFASPRPSGKKGDGTSIP